MQRTSTLGNLSEAIPATILEIIKGMIRIVPVKSAYLVVAISSSPKILPI